MIKNDLQIFSSFKLKMVGLIQILKIPKVLLRHIMMNYLHVKIINIMQTIKEFNILTKENKAFLEKAKECFIYNCAHGNLDVCKWYYENVNVYVDLHQQHDMPFFAACSNGRLKTAKWLYSLGGVDIHANRDETMKFSSRNHHDDVVEWLYSLGGYNKLTDYSL